MASPPFNINQALPGDTDVVSQHPSNARTFRDITESWLLLVSDTYGRIIVAQGNTATRDALTSKVDGTLFVLNDVTPKQLQRWNGSAWESLSPLTATETVSGILEIATQAEADAGTAPDKIITPDKLKAWKPPMDTVTLDPTLDKVVVKDATDDKWKLALLLLAAKPAILQHQLASGTAGTAFSSGSYQTHPLNTEVVDVDGIVSLSSNQFTLGAGTYIIFAIYGAMGASGPGVITNRGRIQNVTDGTTVAYGINQGAVAITPNTYIIVGATTITGSKAFELQVRPGSGTNQQSALSFGDAEVYATVAILKVI